MRTSLLKVEGIYSREIKNFVWRVENRNEKRKEKFDILICVALNHDYEKPQFYIFTSKEAFSVEDVSIPRFTGVKKKIHIFENEEAYRNAIACKPAYVTKYERQINTNLKKFFGRWDKV